jgi:hypothetical protein
MRPNEYHSPAKPKKAKPKTTRGPQGLPIQGSSKQKPKPKPTKTTRGPQGLPIQASSPAKPRPKPKPKPAVHLRSDAAQRTGAKTKKPTNYPGDTPGESRRAHFTPADIAFMLKIGHVKAPRFGDEKIGETVRGSKPAPERGPQGLPIQDSSGQRDQTPEIEGMKVYKHGKLVHTERPRVDVPRTKAELAHFLETGKTPVRLYDPVTAGVKHAGDHGIIGGKVAAPAELYLKNSTRILHGVSGGLRGKNVIHEFKHGHDTMSDVLKDHGIGGVAGEVGGFLLDIPASGSMLKFSLRSPARLLEEKASRQAARGKWEKGFETQVKAKKAATNRGVGVGASVGVPFTGRRFEFSVGERTTSAASRTARLPKVGGKLHDSSVGQGIGHALVPHFRPADQPKDFHKARTQAKRTKRNKDVEADQYAQRRGDAISKAIHKHGGEQTNDEILRAIERQPHKPVVNVKRASRVAQEHKDVTAARRKLRTLDRKEQRVLGRTDVQVPAANRKLVSDELHRITGSRTLSDKDTLRKLDKAIAEGGPKGEAAAALKEYRQAMSARIRTGHELARVRKAERNAHTGAPSLYTDGERVVRSDKVMHAELASIDAAARLKAAEDRLRRVSEEHAGHAARPGAKLGEDFTRVRDFDRKPVGSLSTLEKVRHEKGAARLDYKAAQEKAKGVPRNERYLVDADTGRPLHEVLDERIRHEIEELPAGPARIARTIKNELADSATRLQDAGLIEDPLKDFVHHMRPREKTSMLPLRRSMGKGRAVNAGLTRHREEPRDALSQNMESEAKGKGKKFETDLPTIHANYLSGSEKALNDAEYLLTLKGLGQKVATNTAHNLPDNRVIVEFTGKGIRAMETAPGKVMAEEVHAILEKAKEAGVDSNLRVLPRSAVEEELGLRNPVAKDGWRRGAETMGDWWDRFTAGWKSGVTVYNAPFYQNRNVMDEAFRSWLADTDVKSFLQANKLTVDLARWHSAEKQLDGVTSSGFAKVPRGRVFVGKAHSKDGYMSTMEFLRQVVQDGIGEGFYAGDIPSLLGAKSSEYMLTKLLRQMSAGTEFPARMATYLSALRRGMSREEAAQWMRIHHFAYDELTEFEKNLRRWIPFYTFASRNFQLQLRKSLERPGKYATVQAFREEMAKAAGLPPDWDEKLQETDQRVLPVPVRMGDGEVKIFLMPLSLTDLNRLPLPTPAHKSPMEIAQQQFDMFMQMVHPLPKETAEFLGNHSYFFRGPIYQDNEHPDAPDYVPAPDWLVNFRSILPFPIRTNQTNGRGEKVAVEWPAKIDYLVRLQPQSGFIATLMTTTKNSRDQSAGDRMFGQLTGVRRKSLKPSEDKGLVERISTRLNEITIEKGRLKDTNTADDKGARKVAPSLHFMSKRYQRLVDEEAALKAMRDRLTGRKQSPSLERRPLSPEDALNQKLDKLLDRDPAAELERKLDRTSAKGYFGG